MIMLLTKYGFKEKTKLGFQAVDRSVGIEF